MGSKLSNITKYNIEDHFYIVKHILHDNKTPIKVVEVQVGDNEEREATMEQRPQPNVELTNANSEQSAELEPTEPK